MHIHQLFHRHIRLRSPRLSRQVSHRGFPLGVLPLDRVLNQVLNHRLGQYVVQLLNRQHSRRLNQVVYHHVNQLLFPRSTQVVSQLVNRVHNRADSRQVSHLLYQLVVRRQLQLASL